MRTMSLPAALACMAFLQGCERGPQPVEHLRRVSTPIAVTPGLQLCQPSMVRRSDGTVFFGDGDRLQRLDPQGSVTDLGVAASRITRDVHDNVYVLARGELLRIARDDKVRRIGSITGSAYGIAADPSGNVYLQRTLMPAAYVDKIAPDGRVTAVLKLERVSTHANNWAHQAFGVDSRGNLYFGTWGTVLKIDPRSAVSEFAGHERDLLLEDGDGRGPQASFGGEVTKIAVDAGDRLYVATRAPAFLRRIAPDGTVTTLARYTHARPVDAPVWSSDLVDGDARDNDFLPHSTLDVDAVGNVYFLQCAVNALRKLTPDGRVETLVRGPLNPPGW
jgi:hypothetical protein